MTKSEKLIRGAIREQKYMDKEYELFKNMSITEMIHTDNFNLKIIIKGLSYYAIYMGGGRKQKLKNYLKYNLNPQSYEREYYDINIDTYEKKKEFWYKIYKISEDINVICNRKKTSK